MSAVLKISHPDQGYLKLTPRVHFGKPSFVSSLTSFNIFFAFLKQPTAFTENEGSERCSRAIILDCGWVVGSKIGKILFILMKLL